MRIGYAHLLLSALVLLGCNDEKTEKEEAQDNCHAFSQAWCNRGISCAIEIGEATESERSASIGVCVDMVGSVCGHVESTGATYDQCMRDVKAKPCSEWSTADSANEVEAPASCDDIFTSDY